MRQDALSHDSVLRKKPLAIRALGLFKKLIPGTRLRTWVYLNLIAAPRRAMGTLVNGFYRMDQIYAVLRQVRARYKGRFTILEFGTSDGHSFAKMLYATRYTRMEERVTVHTFDTFEGMPAPQGARDRDPVADDGWVEGEFRGRYEELREYCEGRYRNFAIHKGLFSDSLTPALLETYRREPPILIWFDCDYYSSARSAFEPLLPLIPNGCLVYFDDIDAHMGTRFTGEARLVHEVNRGDFGTDIELVPDLELSLNSNRCFRFFREESKVRYEPIASRHSPSYVRRRTDDSPFP